MSHRRLNSRSIFWRLCLRSLLVKRPQATLGIASLAAGAAVCAMLLSLYGGVQRKMTESFRAFGPNVIIAPREVASGESGLPGVMPEPDLGRLRPIEHRYAGLTAVPALYTVLRASSKELNFRLPGGENALAVGTDLPALQAMNPEWRFQAQPRAAGFTGRNDCAVGVHVATALGLRPGDSLDVRSTAPGASSSGAATETVAAVISAGSSEDDQVFLPLTEVQRLAGLPGKVSVVEVHVPGSAREIERAVQEIARAFPEAGVRPVRQIVYSQGRVLGSVRRLMLALTALILFVVALCVAATMTAIVLERRKDIAVMKALGASDARVMELFLGEGAALGLIGGFAGFWVGALLARALALRLFDVALTPSWWMFPAVCAATVALAIIATLFPVRIVRGVEPAAALKGA
ncbi:MAG: ABC transporter permease [Terriglobia bacterium]